jgi:quercetin dioxygenase-like cupin family protein
MKSLAAAVASAALLIAFLVNGAEIAPASSGVKRTVLNRMEVPNSPYEVVMVLVEVPANTDVGRHTHPGTVVGYVIEGDYTMALDAQPPRLLKTNDTLTVPSGVIHDEYTGAQPAKLIAVFTVLKGQPLATPVAP